MKKLLIALLMILFCTGLAWAENEALTWPVPEVGPDTTIAGYAVFFWDEANPGTRHQYITDGTEVPDIGETLNLRPGGTYSFVIVPYTLPDIPLGDSAPLVWQYGEGLTLENDLPIRIFVDKPSIISIDSQ
jgi:hypothetical protein